VELTLDSGHALPRLRHEASPSRQDVEIRELRRLQKTASEPERRKSLELKIEELRADDADDLLSPGGGTGAQKGSKPSARPWSARPQRAAAPRRSVVLRDVSLETGSPRRAPRAARPSRSKLDAHRRASRGIIGRISTDFAQN